VPSDGMRLDFCLLTLDKTDRAFVNLWKAQLDRIGVDVKEREIDRPNDITPYLWTGHPFVIAAPKKSIEAWLSSLDSDSSLTDRTVATNHRYWWVLTDDDRLDYSTIERDQVTMWTENQQNIVLSAFRELKRTTGLRGFSKQTRDLRRKIERIGAGGVGHRYPVMIFGPSGSGKEETASLLYKSSCRFDRNASGEAQKVQKGKRFYAFGSSAFEGDPQAAYGELFGINKGVFTYVDERKGLLERFTEGVVFLDDFETSPPIVQAHLLRIITDDETPATFSIPGDKTENSHKTDCWLICATNANVTELLASKSLRADFLFRCEDRIITIAPLQDRPADIPPIAQLVWNDLQAKRITRLTESEQETAKGEHRVPHAIVHDRRRLTWRDIRNLVNSQLNGAIIWDGNVRALRTLLGLAVSMGAQAEYRPKSTDSILTRILRRGNSYAHWVEIVASNEFVEPPPREPSKADLVVALDCRKIVETALRAGDWQALKALIGKRLGKAGVEVGLAHACKILVFAQRFRYVTNKRAESVTPLELTQASKYVTWLREGDRFLQLGEDPRQGSEVEVQEADRGKRYKLGTAF